MIDLIEKNEPYRYWVPRAANGHSRIFNRDIFYYLHQMGITYAAIQNMVPVKGEAHVGNVGGYPLFINSDGEFALRSTTRRIQQLTAFEAPDDFDVYAYANEVMPST